jgi:hypothetical protein
MRSGASPSVIDELEQRRLEEVLPKVDVAKAQRPAATRNCAGCGVEFAVLHGRTTHHSPQCAGLQRWREYVQKHGRSGNGRSAAENAARKAEKKGVVSMPAGKFLICNSISTLADLGSGVQALVKQSDDKWSVMLL